MSTETETKKPTVINWALLHELVLRANTAKDFKTLGEAMEVLSGIMSEFPPYFGDGCAQSYFQSACSKAAKYMADKLFAWLENPPPIAPQETQIGPGNPFPIPPPPPPTVAAPTPQAPGSLDAQNAKAIERAAEPVMTPEPWTGESLYLAADMQLMEAPGDWTTLTSFEQKLWMLAASAANERMGSAPSPLKPWTGDELEEAFRKAVWGDGRKEDWQRYSDSMRDDFRMLAMLVNRRMGIE